MITKEGAMKRLFVMVVVLALAAPVAWAGGLAGVQMDEEVMVGSDTVKLNGMGLRKKLWVKVYVGGLYLEHPTTNAENAAHSKQTKKMVMHFLTNKAKKKKMDSAWVEGFEANWGHFGDIKARVMTFKDYFGDMKEGDVVEMTLVPGQGTTIVVNGATKGTIEGDDFAEALVNVWVGNSPPDEGFKKGLLGG
ncbi:MAG: hypothetical protein DRJ65_01070 [Acidobacteria bacterium]|nr:MAG: hypothetical protein DRJ65_01070 [Acidobacteriota bacterium]